MDAQKVDQFMMEKGSYFPAEKAMYIKEKVAALDDSRSYLLDTIPLKNPSTMLVLSICLPGVEKMMLGDVAMGFLKLFTVGGLLVWWFIDIFTITKKVKELNFSKFMSLI